METTHSNLLTSSRTVTLERLPLTEQAPVNLARLKLDPDLGSLTKGRSAESGARGGRRSRRPGPGETFRSEPLTIDISDEFGRAWSGW